MKLGFYSPEISGQNVQEVFEKARAYGFTEVQYNFLTSHGEEMPAVFYPEELEEVAKAAAECGIRITAVNGTFNMVDNDRERLEEYVRRFRLICEAAAFLGAPVVTLCTGSKNPTGMWRYSPESASDEAWKDLIAATRKIMPLAAEYGLIFGVETEASNVIFTAQRNRRYLDEIGDPHLKVIMDCANLFPAGTAKKENVDDTIREAFRLLGPDVVLAHGKDIAESGSVSFASPGMGIVNYRLFFELLKELNYPGGLILHGIHNTADFPLSVDIMRKAMEETGI
ncbi:MAG: sugar phosphate isomerase/epimerase [Lachnospiraceae bacterium]|nr:sugar phosphate isomerase/epimerase [Lachnospiraceae bacterium]